MNAAVHFRLDRFPRRQPRQAAIASLVLWPVVLVLGRMIAYGEGRSARTARTLASGGHPAFTDQVTGPMCRRGGGIPQERCGMPTGSTD
jgi:hypothetical protein